MESGSLVELALFSFARAYFLFDMEIPSAYVQILRSLMPRKPRSEIYAALGLQKQGKNLFYRDFLYHMRHSSDTFRIAPGPARTLPSLRPPPTRYHQPHGATSW